MSLAERLKKILATEEEEEEVDTPERLDKGQLPEAAKEKAAEKPADKKQAKPKLVWKKITLGCKPIDTDLSKEVERFNK